MSMAIGDLITVIGACERIVKCPVPRVSVCVISLLLLEMLLLLAIANIAYLGNYPDLISAFISTSFSIIMYQSMRFSFQ